MTGLTSRATAIARFAGSIPFLFLILGLMPPGFILTSAPRTKNQLSIPQRWFDPDGGLLYKRHFMFSIGKFRLILLYFGKHKG